MFYYTHFLRPMQEEKKQNTWVALSIFAHTPGARRLADDLHPTRFLDLNSSLLLPCSLLLCPRWEVQL